MARKIIVSITLLICLALIGFAYRKQENKNSTLKATTSNYTFLTVNNIFDFNEIRKGNNERHTMLYFYDPEFPKSKPNLDQFSQLYNTYQGSFDFYVVVPDVFYAQDVSISLPKQIDLLIDKNSKFRKDCGISTTPCFEIITIDNKLFFRGDSRKSSFNANPSFDYTSFILDSLILDKTCFKIEFIVANYFNLELPTS